MAEIIHSTRLEEDGPWLINREHLLALDKLVEEEWLNLEKYRDRVITEKVNEEVSRLRKKSTSSFNEAKARQEFRATFESSYEYREKRSLVILLNGQRRVVAKSFEEALRDPALLCEKPEGFVLSFKCCEIECVLELPYYGSSLRLKVEEDRDPIAKEVFASLKSWIDNVKPPYWQQVWLRMKGMQWFYYLMAIGVVLFYLSTIAPDTSASARSVRHDQAVELLKIGVSQTNQFKALELMLSYESGYPPSSRTFVIPSWFWWFFCGAPVFCVSISFIPKVVLGIGNGQEAIKKWTKWMNFVGITFPLWILGTFIWPKLIIFLQNLF